MNKKILVVDDSELIREMLKELLINNGYDVIFAEDGVLGAEKAYNSQPDLIISDIEMPRMTGFQFCRLLKSDNLTKDIPTIILTSKDTPASMFWGLETGADKYLLKNSSPEEILAAVSELLSKSNNRVKQAYTEEIDHWKIVEKMNNLLDKKLFQSTLINEINNVVFESKTVKDAINNLFDILSNILDYSVISYLSLQKENSTIYFNLKSNITEELFQKIQFFMLSSITNLNIDIAEDIEVEISGDFGSKDFNIEHENFYFLPIKVKEEYLGIFTLVVDNPNKISEEVKEIFTKINPILTLVIDNILLYEKIKTLSAIDPLTNIYNRRYFMDIFEKELARKNRFNLDLSIILFDIDNFKKINDTYNHLSGDIVLKNISVILKQSIRKMDIPGRYGGEEFIVILPETNLESALIVAERIRRNVENFSFFSFDGKPIKVTVSLGVASSDRNNLKTYYSTLEFIKVCDGLLYEAKTTGKNKVCH